MNPDASTHRLVIAGTHSGVGKTTVALAADGGAASARPDGSALQGRPRLHRPRASHGRLRPAFAQPRHLDAVGSSCPRHLSPSGCRMPTSPSSKASWACSTAEAPTTSRGSTADVARLLGAPVVLVVDAAAVAGSIAALVKGFREFDPGRPRRRRDLQPRRRAAALRVPGAGHPPAHGRHPPRLAAAQPGLGHSGAPPGPDHGGGPGTRHALAGNASARRWGKRWTWINCCDLLSRRGGSRRVSSQSCRCGSDSSPPLSRGGRKRRRGTRCRLLLLLSRKPRIAGGGRRRHRPLFSAGRRRPAGRDRPALPGRRLSRVARPPAGRE